MMPAPAAACGVDASSAGVVVLAPPHPSPDQHTSSSRVRRRSTASRALLMPPSGQGVRPCGGPGNACVLFASMAWRRLGAPALAAHPATAHVHVRRSSERPLVASQATKAEPSGRAASAFDLIRFWKSGL